MPTLIKERKPTSRGRVRCSLCNRIIGAGEQYDRSTLVYDGHLYDWKQCGHCDRFLSEYDLYDRMGWPAEGYCRDDLFEVEAATWREARLLVLVRQGWTVRGRLLPFPDSDDLQEAPE